MSVACSDTSGEVSKCAGTIKQDLYSTAESTTSFYVPGVPDSREKSFIWADLHSTGDRGAAGTEIPSAGITDTSTLVWATDQNNIFEVVSESNF